MDQIHLGLMLIHEMLKTHPGNAYVTPDKKLLCVLLPNDELMVMPGDYTNSTEEDINQHIQNMLKKI